MTEPTLPEVAEIEDALVALRNRVESATLVAVDVEAGDAEDTLCEVRAALITAERAIVNHRRFYPRATVET